MNDVSFVDPPAHDTDAPHAGGAPHPGVPDGPGVPARRRSTVMAETLTAAKADLVDLAHRRMQSAIPDNDWTVRQKLALTCRILFDAGHDSGLAGQITARAERPGTYYTQQLGLGFDEITESNLLLVDEDLNVLEGGGMANPANRFHSWVYRARPDVNCIIHTHPLHISALSMLETPLVVSHMDLCPLYDDCAFLEKWPGIPVGNEEGELISAALGDKRALLLAHHGQLVATGTVEESCTLAVLFERAARLQLLASAAGRIQEIPELLAREAHDWTSTPKRGQANFAYYARRALRAGHGDALVPPGSPHTHDAHDAHDTNGGA
ncbi:aldolase [Kitasatospora sp. NPDC058406]|uniref:aldolase n=1 Tax=Kitasatospora sp. NPDC058406 TaxID=3346483 RepID=UPI0036468445